MILSHKHQGHWCIISSSWFGLHLLSYLFSQRETRAETLQDVTLNRKQNLLLPESAERPVHEILPGTTL